MIIRNPVLKGFNPDPSILRLGEDYYLATSTFEWFPGVALYHSRDLANWRPIGHALTGRSQLDMMGVIDSAGVWAPSLSHADGQFYLLYTVVRTRVGVFKDVHNFLVTAPSIHGPWSAPIFLNSSGFDPSLFHDEDGRKWVVNVQWDHRKGKPRFGGIILQEYSHEHRRMVGPVTTLLTKPHLIEGPNLYRRGGMYYLMLAEGGTGWNHGISMARSATITGPYELDPQPLLLTSRKSPAARLQKAGHGELVQTAGGGGGGGRGGGEGEWYLAHLASRPLYPERRCILGRETSLQKVQWNPDGWLRLAHGGVEPADEVPGPAGLREHPWPAEPARDDFDAPTLGPAWQSLRVPMESRWLSLSERPGWLRLRGRESQQSLFEQSLVARRLRSLRTTVETCLEFQPEHFSQSAGLICYYDTRTHYYLRLTHDEARGRLLGVTLTDDGNYDELIESQLAVGDWPRCHLRAVFEEDRLRFSASPDGRAWQPIGPPLDASKLSDDYGAGLHFTGAFVGLCAQDLRGTRLHADFDYFEMLEAD